MSALFHAEITADDCTGSNVTLIGSSSGLAMTAESPWDGDTETGFGRDVTVTLPLVKAIELRDAINRWLARHGVGP